jgi:hypothetical protein
VSTPLAMVAVAAWSLLAIGFAGHAAAGDWTELAFLVAVAIVFVGVVRLRHRSL